MLTVRASASPAPAPWLEISEQSACEAMPDEYCLGRYGFSIRPDGTFLAGGSGGARTIEGKIAPKELREINLLLAEASTGVKDAQPTCSKGGLPGVRDQIALRLADGSVVRIYDLGGRIGHVCHIGSSHAVQRLHDYLRNLMARYYPRPFPAR